MIKFVSGEVYSYNIMFEFVSSRGVQHYVIQVCHVFVSGGVLDTTLCDKVCQW